MNKALLNLRPLEEKHLKKIRELAPDYTVISSLEEAEDRSAIKAVYGWNTKDGQTLIDDSSNDVQWIQLASAGADYMDFDQLKNQKITLTNASGIHKFGIAESVFGMLLSHTRGIGHSIKMQAQSRWEPISSGQEMHGKTMLIVGAGEIGQQTAKLAQAFGMKTVGVNRSGRSVDYMDEQVTQANLKEELPEADVVVNILPLTDETKNLFDLSLFRKMKKSAVFINVGRGQTVVTDDLMTALDEGRLTFAALDVVHQEPLPSDHPLYKREDVLLTPHISGNLDAYDESLFAIFEENLKAFAAGEDLPKNVVDYSAGY